MLARRSVFRTSQAVLRRSSLALRLKSAPAAPAEQVTAVEKAATKATSTTSAATSSRAPIAQCLAAAILGVGSVSIAAAAVEHATASSVPVYDPRGQRFDQSHFMGRFSRMLLACDPALLLYSEDQVRRAHALLQQYQEYDANDLQHRRTLWEARRMVDAALHPDTGTVIPRPFRMSGYVPFNGPICVAMIASTSTAPLLFWSWANQSQNALVNYYNRNASSSMSNTTLAVSYGAAVGSALAVAFGLATWIQRRYSPTQAKALLQWVAFPSAIVASSLNCYIVRSPEMVSGVPLQDEHGNRLQVVPNDDNNNNNNDLYNNSQEAAKRGVYLTTASRALLQAPVYFLPPALMSIPIIQRTVPVAMIVPVTTYLLLISFGIGLPATVALFPQMATISSSNVESRFQALRDPITHKPYTHFYYNKGL